MNARASMIEIAMSNLTFPVLFCTSHSNHQPPLKILYYRHMGIGHVDQPLRGQLHSASSTNAD
jgi:hypothetical protein